MKTKTLRNGAGWALACLLLAFAGASCMSSPPSVEYQKWFDSLPQGKDLYASLNVAAEKPLLKEALMGAMDGDMLRMLDYADAAYVAVKAVKGGDAKVWAILVGTMPGGIIQSQLAASKDMEKREGYFAAKKGGTEVAVPFPYMLAVSNGGMPELLASIAKPAPGNVGADFALIAKSSLLAAYIPSPQERLFPALLPASVKLPVVDGELLVGAVEGGYRSRLQLDFASDRDARVSLPIFKMALMALSSAGSGPTALFAGMKGKAEGPAIVFEGPTLANKDFVAMIAALAAPPKKAPADAPTEAIPDGASADAVPASEASTDAPAADPAATDDFWSE